MQFTPQQLSGAGRYNHCTRIGNWNEDLVLEESRMKEYRLRKQRGQLATKRQQSKLSVCNQRVPHSYSEDGCMRYGDYVIFSHAQSGDCLANDLWEETSPGSGEFAVTICQSRDPIARNVFKIIHPSDDEIIGGIINYGDPFRIMCNESLRIDYETDTLKPMYYLKSVIKSDRAASPISSNQLVSMSLDQNAHTLWYCVDSTVGGPAQTLSNGTPINVSKPVSVVHQMTRQALYADKKYQVVNDFDKEYEVCCATIRNPAKCHNLDAEKSGKATADTVARTALPQNAWILTMSSSPNAAIDDRNIPQPSKALVILYKLREFIEQGCGYRSVACTLDRLDPNGNGTIDREDIKWSLKDNNIALRDDQFDTLLDAFDKSRNGLISLREFLLTLRGDLNSRREEVVNAVFDQLEKKNDGVVTLQVLCEAYNAVSDQKVTRGDVEKEDALQQFLKGWNNQKRTTKISRNEFLDYYRDISACIADDDRFVDDVKRSWKLDKCCR